MFKRIRCTKCGNSCRFKDNYCSQCGAVLVKPKSRVKVKRKLPSKSKNKKPILSVPYFGNMSKKDIIVFCAFTLGIILALVGLFGVTYQITSINGIDSYDISYYFFRGWDVMKLQSTNRDYTVDKIQFLFQFAGYLVTFAGVIYVFIRHAIEITLGIVKNKSNSVNYAKTLKRLVLFVLPQLFFATIMGARYTTNNNDSLLSFKLGWGSILLISAVILCFAFKIVDEIKQFKEPLAAYILKNVGFISLVALTIFGFKYTIAGSFLKINFGFNFIHGFIQMSIRSGSETISPLVTVWWGAGIFSLLLSFLSIMLLIGIKNYIVKIIFSTLLVGEFALVNIGASKGFGLFFDDSAMYYTMPLSCILGMVILTIYLGSTISYIIINNKQSKKSKK